MKVWRIEGGNGEGPFCNGHICIPFGDPRLETTHRTPASDGLNPVALPWYWVFGAPSLCILGVWFEEFIQDLQHRGYSIKLYDVPEPYDGDEFYLVGRSGTQVLFSREDSKLIKEFKIS